MPFTSCASSLPPQAPAGAPGSLLPGCSDLAAPGLPADSSPQLETLGLRTRGRAPEGRPGPAQIQEIPPRSFASSGSNSRSGGYPANAVRLTTLQHGLPQPPHSCAEGNTSHRLTDADPLLHRAARLRPGPGPAHSRVPHVDARHHLVAVRAGEAVAAAPVSQKVVQLLHRDPVVGHGQARAEPRRPVRGPLGAAARAWPAPAPPRPAPAAA